MSQPWQRRVQPRPFPSYFMNGSDPVANGLVSTFAHPGGNVTGVSAYSGILDSKRVELLHELVPNATVIGELVNPRDEVSHRAGASGRSRYETTIEGSKRQ